MSDPYHSPEKFNLRLLYEANAGESYTFDMLVIWAKEDNSLLMGTDSGCSCPSPFENQGLSDLEPATPSAVNEWFDGPEWGPRRHKLEAGERQKVLALFEVKHVNNNIDKEIAEAEAKLETLKIRKSRLAKQTPEQRIAELLHSLFCHSNHADGCAWMYETDVNNVPEWHRDTHASYVRKATKFCDLVGEDVNVEQFLVELAKAMHE